MRACLLSIGDELTAGQERESNAAWLAGQLSARAVTTVELRVVPDDRTAIAGAIRDMAARCDLLLATGGIGPTAEAAVTRTYGLEYRKPLTQLGEYLTAIRTLLHTGELNVEGEHVVSRTRIAAPVQTPVMASASSSMGRSCPKSVGAFTTSAPVIRNPCRCAAPPFSGEAIACAL